MYSLILLVGMTAQMEAPQGIIFNRGGCGAFGTPVRSVVAKRPVRTFLANRPVVFGRTCGGVSATTSYSKTVTTTYSRMPLTPEASVATPPEMEGPLSRIVVRRQLNKVLNDPQYHGKLSKADKQLLIKAAQDPDVFNAAVAKVHKDMSKEVMRMGAVGKIGDGAILKMLIDNLPAIIAAVKEIWALFN